MRQNFVLSLLCIPLVLASSLHHLPYVSTVFRLYDYAFAGHHSAMDRLKEIKKDVSLLYQSLTSSPNGPTSHELERFCPATITLSLKEIERESGYFEYISNLVAPSLRLHFHRALFNASIKCCKPLCLPTPVQFESERTIIDYIQRDLDTAIKSITFVNSIMDKDTIAIQNCLLVAYSHIKVMTISFVTAVDVCAFLKDFVFVSQLEQTFNDFLIKVQEIVWLTSQKALKVGAADTGNMSLIVNCVIREKLTITRKVSKDWGPTKRPRSKHDEVIKNAVESDFKNLYEKFGPWNTQEFLVGAHDFIWTNYSTHHIFLKSIRKYGCFPSFATDIVEKFSDRLAPSERVRIKAVMSNIGSNLIGIVCDIAFTHDNRRILNITEDKKMEMGCLSALEGVHSIFNELSGLKRDTRGLHMSLFVQDLTMLSITLSTSMLTLATVGLLFIVETSGAVHTFLERICLQAHAMALNTSQLSRCRDEQSRTMGINVLYALFTQSVSIMSRWNLVSDYGPIIAMHDQMAVAIGRTVQLKDIINTCNSCNTGAQ